MKFEIFDRMEECTEQAVQQMLSAVSAQRRDQALRFKHTFGQFFCLKSWMMLNQLLDGKALERGEWRYNEHGKPYWEQGPYFSISHCKEGIAVVVDEHPIGIDIEGIRHADEALIERVMNDEERLAIHDDRDFTRLWTQKEAVVKALGTGITSFEQVQHILSEYRDGELSKCRNISTIEKEKYIYSIAYE